MSNSKDNVITRQLHGKFGDQVIVRTRYGKSYTATFPKTKGKAPGAAQQQTRDRFRMATQWAKVALSDPGQLEAYKAKAKNGITAFVAAINDFLRPPRVSEILYSGYNGHAGDKILVSAFDDFHVKEVSLKITDPSGTMIEQGPCQPDENSMYWQFTATVAVPTLTGVKITAIAIDNPGHAGASFVTLE
jgi:hypothetical protein